MPLSAKSEVKIFLIHPKLTKNHCNIFLFVNGLISYSMDRLLPDLRQKIPNSSKSYPWVPRHVWHIDHPLVLLQVLALHGCLPVYISKPLRVPATYLTNITASLDPVQTAFTVKQFKSHCKVGTPAKIKQLLVECELLLAQKASRQ